MNVSDGSRPATFSSVALTFISIIVALGMEHLLGQLVALLRDTSGVYRVLVVTQGLATFTTISAIWVAYATQLMTATWEPRFEDFLAPLLILSLLYFWISAIGTSGPAWFYISTLGWGIAFVGNHFSLPPPVAARLKPTSSIARRSMVLHLVLPLLAASAGIAVHVGMLGVVGAAALALTLGIIQLACAWVQLQWWRAA